MKAASRPAILYVDDEEKSLEYFSQLFGEDFPIFVAKSAREGLQILEENAEAIGVVMSDQRMPGETGVEFLEKVRRLNPSMVRILVTAFTDYDAAMSAVNEGGIHKHLKKPWEFDHLEEVLQQSLAWHDLLRERDQLLAEKASTIQNILMADRVAGVGILAEGMNHHFRNALTSLRTFLEMIPETLEDTLDGAALRNEDFWVEFREAVVSQVDRMEEVLDQMWSVSYHRTRKDKAEVSLSEVIQESATLLKEKFLEKKITLEISIEDDLPPIEAYASQMVQLFRLLLEEEHSVISEGGQLFITAVEVEEKGEPGVLICVEDDGPRISEDQSSRVFDPFYMRAKDSNALGVNLAACYVIIFHHKGWIKAEPWKEGGTRLRVWLPQKFSARTEGNAESFLGKMKDFEMRWQNLQSRVVGVS